MGADGNGSDRKDIMNSHNDGEVWGLCQGPDGNIVTSGDDNKIMLWDPTKRCLVKCSEITPDKKDLKGASSQSSKPSSQQGRAVAFSTISSLLLATTELLELRTWRPAMK